MLNKIIKYKYQILELIIIFIVILSYNLICSNLSGDEIWNYGFSYNISTGLIPYKDFNMIITPLFPLIGALFLNIFGKTFLMYHIFNAIMCTILFPFLKEQNKNNYYIAYLLIIINSYPSYNILSMLLLYILIHCEKKKTNDYLIGVILGLTILTKQNIGIYLCIATLFIKNIKKISRRIIGLLIPNLILLVYLLATNSLLEFIDYTILGIFSFSKGNNNITTPVIILFLITTTYLIYKYIKTKDITIIYIIMFQLLVYPMSDIYHIIISLTPVIGYSIKDIKIPKIIPLIFCITYLITALAVNIKSVTNRTTFLPNDTKIYTYKKLTPKTNNYIIKSSSLLTRIKKDEELFVISKDSYLIKLEASIPINKYDLLNNGNLGKSGEEALINNIEKICQNKKCIFLIELETTRTSGYAKEIKNYIKSNYIGGNIIDNFMIYKN